MRPTPWRDINGNWVQPAAWSSVTPGTSTSSPSPRAPRFIPIDAHEITAIAVGRSDAINQVSNWFLTYPAPYEQFAAGARQLGSKLLGGANPSICGDPSFSAPVRGASDYHLFGWRPFERWTPYAAFPGADSTPSSIDGELNRRLASAFSFGEYLESGLITIVRDPANAALDPIHIGDYLSLTGGFDDFGIEWSSGTFAYVEIAPRLPHPYRHE